MSDRKLIQAHLNAVIINNGERRSLAEHLRTASRWQIIS